MNRNSILIFLVLLTITCKTISQQVHFLPSFDVEAREQDRIQLIGKIDSNYYLYIQRPGVGADLLILNDSGQLTKTVPLNFIDQKAGSSVNIVLQGSFINMIVQEIKGNKHFVKTVSLNSNGEQLTEPRNIDSSAYDQYGNHVYYRVLTSPNTRQVLLYRIVSGFSSIQILFNGIILNEQGEKLASNFFYLPFNAEMETVGNLFITDEGKLILPIYDRFDNFRLGTTLKLYYSALKSPIPTMMDFYFKEKKLIELMLDWDESKNRIAIGSLYFDFYSKSIEGAMSIFLQPEINSLDTVIYMPIDKPFKKQLKSKIYNVPSKEVVNALRIRYFDVNEKGEIKILSDLLVNAGMYGKGVPIVQGTNSPFDNRQNYLRTIPTSPGSNTQEREISNYVIANNTSTAIAPGSQRTQIADRSSVGTGNTNTNTTSARSSGARLATGQQNLDGNFSRNQTSMLNTNNANQPLSTSMDARNLALNSKTISYKSVLFQADSTQAIPGKSLSSNFFVPGSEFTNIIIVPGSRGLGLINYELNPKSNPVLTQFQFNRDGSITQAPIGKSTDPLLFYKRNSIIYEKNNMLSLYVEPQTNRLGLVVVRSE